MHDNDRMDVYMVCGDKDIRLLRHFLTSYDLFFKSPGKIFLWVWKKHEYLLQGIALPENLVLLFKDDVPELTADDFKNQMYLKLIAYRYVETEWFWVADTDYVIVSPLKIADFFAGEKPYWFYCDWYEVAEKTFRSGSESFFGKKIPLQFLDEQQFVHSKKLSREFCECYEPKNILSKDYLAAEQMVYGAYAYEKNHDLYQWVNYATYNGPVVSYKVNQRPPSYCELNDEVRLIDLPAAKYHVFWSHWEKAEEKIIEFLIDAQLRAFGKVIAHPETTRLFRYWPPSQINLGSLSGVDGLYGDGWLMRDVWFSIPTDERSILLMEFLVPGVPSGGPSRLRLSVDINGEQQIKQLDSGAQTIKFNLDRHLENRISFRFDGGFAEPQGSRTLFAQIGAVSLVPLGRFVEH